MVKIWKQFNIKKDVEDEYCYQVRTEESIAGVKPVSDKICLWVVSFPTNNKPWSNEAVMVNFADDTPIHRIKEIIVTEGATVLNIVPDINLLLVRIESDTPSNVINRFKKYEEVEFVMLDFTLESNNDVEFSKEKSSIFMAYHFESNLKDWEETCFTTDKLDQFTATDGDKFLVCTTYPNGKTAWIKRAIDIPKTDSISISFDYNILTQEDKTIFNDKIRLSLVDPNGNMTSIVANVAEIPMSDSKLQLTEGEIAIKQTGWQSTSVEIPITESDFSSSGKGFLSIIMHSENDPSIGGKGESNNLHSALLVDNIKISRSE